MLGRVQRCDGVFASRASPNVVRQLLARELAAVPIVFLARTLRPEARRYETQPHGSGVAAAMTPPP